MKAKFVDNRKENLIQNLNLELIRDYGSRLTLSKLKETGKNKFEIYFNYNKVFHVIDDKTKTVFVRNIFFSDIYSKKIRLNEKLKLPVHDINKVINDEFNDTASKRNVKRDKSF